jgi:hypothetical protein
VLGRAQDENVAASAPYGFTLDVVAIDVADAVCAAGGLIFDRVHEGWAVRVFVLDELDRRVLRISRCPGFRLRRHHRTGHPHISARRWPCPAPSWTAATVSTRCSTTSWQLSTDSPRLRRPSRAMPGRPAQAGDCAEQFHGLGGLCVPGIPDLTPIGASKGLTYRDVALQRVQTTI